MKRWSIRINFKTRILQTPCLLIGTSSCCWSLYQDLFYSQFNLKARDSYFKTLVEVLTKNILAKNIFRKLYKVNRTQDHGLKTRKQVPNYLAMS